MLYNFVIIHNFLKYFARIGGECLSKHDKDAVSPRAVKAFTKDTMMDVFSTHFSR